ncbi:MAG: single-stranded DNA-binding protein [Planctomycetota bacterium]
MAGSVNKVFLMGNLTRDVEMRSLPSGMSVGNFGLAVNERFKDRDGNWQDRANFIDCEIFGGRADAMARYLSKGSPVFVEGKLRLDQWEDRNSGQKRSRLKVVVDNFEFVGGGRGDSQGPRGDGGGGGSYDAPQPSGAGGGGYDPVTEDDIPF